MITRSPVSLHSLVLLLLLIVAGRAACAHEIRPAIATVSFPSSQRIEIEITTNLEALVARIGPNHKDSDDSPNAANYTRLRAMPPAALAERFHAFLPELNRGLVVSADGKPLALESSRLSIPEVGNQKLARISKLVLAGRLPHGSRSITWSYDARFGSSVLRVRDVDGRVKAIGWLEAGKSSGPVSLGGIVPKPATTVFAEYIALGFTHIMPKGLDHILFVLGLYFLSPRLRPLLTQVTAFTVAHSVTLALGLYGIVSVSPGIVEPLIAASIVYVAVENLFSTNVSGWRTFVVFGFGLLHGLGFAGVLREIGLPQSDYLLGLIAFNIGVEGGQLAVIGPAWLATGLWFARAPWYRRRVAMPASLAIAAVGLYWTIERVLDGIG